MNALELKQKIKQTDNNKTFLKILGLSLLLSLVVFPINYLVNPDIDPIVHDSPLLLGFGFTAFFAMFLVFMVGGLSFTMFLLDSYLFATPKFLNILRRFNANSVLNDVEIIPKISKGVYLNLQKMRTDDFILQIDEAKEGLQSQIDELKENDVRKDRHIVKQNQDIFGLKLEITKLKNENNKLKSKKKEIDQLVSDRTLTKNTDTVKHVKNSNKLDFSIE